MKEGRIRKKMKEGREQAAGRKEDDYWKIGEISGRIALVWICLPNFIRWKQSLMQECREAGPGEVLGSLLPLSQEWVRYCRGKLLIKG